jgi:D-xylose transport system ATP-binding protein
VPEGTCLLDGMAARRTQGLVCHAARTKGVIARLSAGGRRDGLRQSPTETRTRCEVGQGFLPRLTDLLRLSIDDVGLRHEWLILITLRGIQKSFGGVQALRGVDLTVDRGEVVALVGHNGAGKSVLVQIISGVFAPSAGTIEVAGLPTSFASPNDARRHGIETIFQTLALADNLDAPANFFLGRELRTRFGFLDNARMNRETAAALQALNPEMTDIERPVRQMSGGQRQAIAIGRAIHFDVKLLVMDEPTAALGPHETAQVGALIERLRAKGIAILLISHDVRDVMRLADRIVVLKGGEVVGTLRARDTTEDAVVDLIVRGRQLTSGGST